MTTKSQTLPQTQNTPTPAAGLLQRQCACGNHMMAGGECAACAKKRIGLQRKLTIGASNDPLEREADRVADQVLVAPAHSTVGGAPPHIQRYAGHATEAMDTAPASVDRVLASSGRPLEPALRQDMEQRFGHDFSQVRVHTDAAAEQSARDVSANAYTVGHNVVFGAGWFAPETHEGRRLIAHELTHVVQQSGTDGIRVGQGNVQRSSEPAIRDADLAAPAYSIGNSDGLKKKMFFSGILQKKETDEIPAPDLEAVPGGDVPVASVDPSRNSDFIDRRIIAVGVGLSGADFILFCEGIEVPIALPFDYIDLSNTKSIPIDQFIYLGREEALKSVPFGPPAPGMSSQFAYYRAVGGLVVPTRFSITSAPETVRLIYAARRKLSQLVKDVTNTLVTAVLLWAGGALVQRGISKWIVRRGTLARQRLDEAKIESMPDKGKKGITSNPEDNAEVGPSVKSVPTVRPRATTQQLRDMIANYREYYTWRAPERDSDIAMNQPIRFTGQNTPKSSNTPQGVYVTRGVRGLGYGDYAVTVKGNKFYIRGTPDELEFVIEGEIQANEGVWFTAEDYAAAKGFLPNP